jgi:hypothetical protein
MKSVRRAQSISPSDKSNIRSVDAPKEVSWLHQIKTACRLSSGDGHFLDRAAYA